jgi:hypothetical protein
MHVGPPKGNTEAELSTGTLCSSFELKEDFAGDCEPKSWPRLVKKGKLFANIREANFIVRAIL